MQKVDMLPELPNEEQVLKVLAEILQGMAEYRKKVNSPSPTFQRLTLQASEHGWLVQFRSDDYSSAFFSSVMREELLEALQTPEGSDENPITW